MRRKRAILLFGGLGLALVGYGAWCWHPFYLGAKVEFGESVTETEAVSIALYLEESDKLAIEPLDWSWSLAWNCLKYPRSVRRLSREYSIEKKGRSFEVLEYVEHAGRTDRGGYYMHRGTVNWRDGAWTLRLEY